MEEFHAKLQTKGLVGEETAISVEELHRLMCESVEPGPEDQLAQQELITATQGEGILLGTAEDSEVAQTCMAGKPHVCSEPLDVARKDQTGAESTTDTG